MSQIVRDITEITRCSTQYRNDRLMPMGLRSCHASYLSEICEHPGISQDRLARHICINKSYVARQAAYLEEAGFITRTPSEVDRRVLELRPCQKALDLLPRILEILGSWEACITCDLTEEEKAIASQILTRMKARSAAYMEERRYLRPTGLARGACLVGEGCTLPERYRHQKGFDMECRGGSYILLWDCHWQSFYVIPADAPPALLKIRPRWTDFQRRLQCVSMAREGQDPPLRLNRRYSSEKYGPVGGLCISVGEWLAAPARPRHGNGIEYECRSGIYPAPTTLSRRFYALAMWQVR